MAPSLGTLHSTFCYCESQSPGRSLLVQLQLDSSKSSLKCMASSARGTTSGKRDGGGGGWGEGETEREETMNLRKSCREVDTGGGK